MNLEPIDPKWLKADLERALGAYETCDTTQAIASLEAYRDKLQMLLTNLEEIEAALSLAPDQPNPNQ